MEVKEVLHRLIWWVAFWVNYTLSLLVEVFTTWPPWRGARRWWKNLRHELREAPRPWEKENR